MSTVRHTLEEINGISTEFLVQEFSDRILVFITQMGKVGNLVGWYNLDRNLQAETSSATNVVSTDTGIYPFNRAASSMA